MDIQARQDRVMDRIKEKVGVAPIVGKMVESNLRWFGHERRPLKAPIRRVDKVEDRLIVEGGERVKDQEKLKLKQLEKT